MSKPRRSKHTAAIPGVLLSIALLGCFPCMARLDAGTVFMKNGYIIQGPIVDQDETKVVLGWENGKVFIYRRFMESVVLDADEKAGIDKRKSESESMELQPFLKDDIVISGNMEEELPENFNDMVSLYKIERDDGDLPLDGSADGGQPFSMSGGEPNSTGEVPHGSKGTDGGEVTEIPPDGGEEAPRVIVPELGLSLEPPPEWFRDTGGGGVRWAGAPQEDRFRPSLVLITTEVAEWDEEDALRALEEDPLEVFPDFQVVEKGRVVVHGRPAFQVVGLGHPLGYPGRAEGFDGSLSVRQILIPGEGRFWLLTVFSSEETSREDLAALDRAIESIHFLDSQE